VVPAQWPLAKLIVLMGRAGTTDQITRFALGTAPNMIAPLPAPYADPSDKSGGTALAEIPGKVGVTYKTGVLDMSLDALSLAPGPFGNHTADDGKQFLVATVTVTNHVWTGWYFNDNIKTTLKTDDDKLTDHIVLKAKHDDDFDGRKLDMDESVTQRIILQVPKDAELKTLTLTDDMGDNGQSPDFVYDVSGLK
jgi:hypothetical protein